MNIIKTELEDVLILEPKVFQDDRGYFFESFNENKFKKLIGDIQFVQDNESKSTYGVIRGLHFQKPPYAQAKLVRAVVGSVLDVVVDLRSNSLTYGQHITVLLSEENKRQLYIPRGFAHGFSVLSPEAVFQYKCDNYYAPNSEGSLIWNDKTLNINWEIPINDAIISEKDSQASVFSTFRTPF